jgi:hypothetical protein
MFYVGENCQLAHRVLPSQFSSSNDFDHKILSWKEFLGGEDGSLWILEDSSFRALHLACTPTIVAPASIPFQEEHVLSVSLRYSLRRWLVVSRTSAEAAEDIHRECQGLTNY